MPFREPCKTPGKEEAAGLADTASLAGLVWKHQVTFMKFLIRKFGESLHKKAEGKDLPRSVLLV